MRTSENQIVGASEGKTSGARGWSLEQAKVRLAFNLFSLGRRPQASWKN